MGISLVVSLQAVELYSGSFEKDPADMAVWWLFVCVCPKMSQAVAVGW